MGRASTWGPSGCHLAFVHLRLTNEMQRGKEDLLVEEILHRGGTRFGSSDENAEAWPGEISR